jgi:hypothetical protein
MTQPESSNTVSNVTANCTFARVMILPPFLIVTQCKIGTVVLWGPLDTLDSGTPVSGRRGANLPAPIHWHTVCGATQTFR